MSASSLADFARMSLNRYETVRLPSSMVSDVRHVELRQIPIPQRASRHSPHAPHNAISGRTIQ